MTRGTTRSGRCGMRTYHVQVAAPIGRSLILICLAAMSGTARSADDPVVLNVWPGETVGDFGNTGPERVRKPEEAPTPDAKWVTNVTVPTITVYRPEAA